MDGGGGVGFRIESLWAYLAVHADGDEGVIGGQIGFTSVPFVAADKRRLDQLRPVAEKAARLPGAPPIILVRFTTRIDVETL